MYIWNQDLWWYISNQQCEVISHVYIRYVGVGIPNAFFTKGNWLSLVNEQIS